MACGRTHLLAHQVSRGQVPGVVYEAGHLMAICQLQCVGPGVLWCVV